MNKRIERLSVLIVDFLLGLRAFGSEKRRHIMAIRSLLIPIYRVLGSLKCWSFRLPQGFDPKILSPMSLWLVVAHEHLDFVVLLFGFTGR